MKNPVTLMVTLVSVQFVLYTISLCAPQYDVSTGVVQSLAQAYTFTNGQAIAVSGFYALFCMSSLTCFLATLVLQDPYLLHNLGWSFYICCATLIYALVVNVALGLVRVATAIEPATTIEKTSELAMSHIKSP
ncbi:UNVERIFIED_CONTAM: hypothetical protein FKN15_063047 [Acipenser sinensis]